MGSLVQLFPRLNEFGSVENIPRWVSEESGIALAQCCSPLVEGGNTTLAVMTKHNEMVFGLQTLDEVIQFYRVQKEIRAVLRVPLHVVDNVLMYGTSGKAPYEMRRP